MTAAEAYHALLKTQNISLNFRSKEVLEFELHQNIPNPFDKETMIRFTLPESMPTTLTMYDVVGKVLKVVEVESQRGTNQTMVSKSELIGVGVLYYQLDAEDYTATKKMLVIE